MPRVAWIVLTLGGRPEALHAAVGSLQPDVTVVVNGRGEIDCTDALVTSPGENLGVPAGRGWGLRHTIGEFVGFLDDDAVAEPGIGELILQAFEADPSVGAVALRIVDEDGATSRRHVPRFGGRHPERGGDVALFLGGASAIRREAYLDAGGYWGELFYGHEELELAWRLIDRGWKIRYLPEARVFHPRTEIGRHAEGWRLTGRNRVMIARRTLPWPVAIIHVSAWLVLGILRAPAGEHRRAYLAGWRAGWRVAVDHRPIRWRTVWRLTGLGRPPVL